jgi:hypothetical protein
MRQVDRHPSAAVQGQVRQRRCASRARDCSWRAPASPPGRRARCRDGARSESHGVSLLGALLWTMSCRERVQPWTNRRPALFSPSRRANAVCRKACSRRTASRDDDRSNIQSSFQVAQQTSSFDAHSHLIIGRIAVGGAVGSASPSLRRIIRRNQSHSACRTASRSRSAVQTWRRGNSIRQLKPSAANSRSTVPPSSWGTSPRISRVPYPDLA